MKENTSQQKAILHKDGSAYQLYLPDKLLLKSKLKQWIDEFQEVTETETDERTIN